MKKSQQSHTEYIRTPVRLPPDLHAEVKRAAAAAGRPMDAELRDRIASVDERATLKLLVQQNAELKAMMLEMLDRMDNLK